MLKALEEIIKRL